MPVLNRCAGWITQKLSTRRSLYNLWNTSIIVNRIEWTSILPKEVEELGYSLPILGVTGKHWYQFQFFVEITSIVSFLFPAKMISRSVVATMLFSFCITRLFSWRTIPYSLTLTPSPISISITEIYSSFTSCNSFLRLIWALILGLRAVFWSLRSLFLALRANVFTHSEVEITLFSLPINCWLVVLITFSMFLSFYFSFNYFSI